MAILAKGGEFAPAVIFLIVAEARMSVFTFLYIAIFNRTLRIDMSKLAFFPKFTEAKFVVLADVINHFLIFFLSSYFHKLKFQELKSFVVDCLSDCTALG